MGDYEIISRDELNDLMIDSVLTRMSPFKSKQQRKWMYATHPKMAERWEKETPKGKKLPKKVKRKK